VKLSHRGVDGAKIGPSLPELAATVDVAQGEDPFHLIVRDLAFESGSSARILLRWY
jgi:hypothetical protein